jgi:hypothetical protein
VCQARIQKKIKAYYPLLNEKKTIVNRTEQYLQECGAWQRLLDFFRQENAYLKTRLSEVLDNKTGREFLNDAEFIQNTSVLKDEFITEIIADVKKQEKKLNETLLLKKTPGESAGKQQQKLRNEIERLERDFTNMKNDFNKKIFSLL